jgi:hypothetical protein
MRGWVIVFFVFLTLSNSSGAEERSKHQDRELIEAMKKLGDSIKQLKETAPGNDSKLMMELMMRISNTCQTPEGSCPLPSSAFKGTTCSCNFDKRVFGTAQ